MNKQNTLWIILGLIVVVIALMWFSGAYYPTAQPQAGSGPSRIIDPIFQPPYEDCFDVTFCPGAVVVDPGTGGGTSYCPASCDKNPSGPECGKCNGGGGVGGDDQICAIPAGGCPTGQTEGWCGCVDGGGDGSGSPGQVCSGRWVLSSGTNPRRDIGDTDRIYPVSY